MPDPEGWLASWAEWCRRLALPVRRPPTKPPRSNSEEPCSGWYRLCHRYSSHLPPRKRNVPPVPVRFRPPDSHSPMQSHRQPWHATRIESRQLAPCNLRTGKVFQRLPVFPRPRTSPLVRSETRPSCPTTASYWRVSCWFRYRRATRRSTFPTVRQMSQTNAAQASTGATNRRVEMPWTWPDTRLPTTPHLLEWSCYRRPKASVLFRHRRTAA